MLPLAWVIAAPLIWLLYSVVVIPAVERRALPAGTLPLPDPLHAVLPLRDSSYFIASLVWLSGILALPSWEELLPLHTAVVVARCVFLWATPLAPPANYIANPFPPPDSRALMFSGHTAFFMCNYLGTKGVIHLGIAFIAALLMMMQRVHYTADILVALCVPIAVQQAMLGAL